MNRVTGELSDWNPGVDSQVNALAIAADVLYVGGDFGRIAGEERENLAALDLETRTVLPWNPIVDERITQIVPS